MGSRWYHRIGLGDFCDSLDELAAKLFPEEIPEPVINKINQTELIIDSIIMLLATIAIVGSAITALIRRFKKQSYLKEELNNRNTKVESYELCYSSILIAKIDVRRKKSLNSNIDYIQNSDGEIQGERTARSNTQDQQFTEAEDELSVEQHLDYINQYLIYENLEPVNFEDLRIFSMLLVDDMTENLIGNYKACINKYLSYCKLLQNPDDEISTTEDSNDSSFSAEEQDQQHSGSSTLNS